MNNFSWKDEYKIDHGVIDAQHQQLFNLANQIITVSDTNELTRMLMLLYQHVRVHFLAEENLMKETNYPRYQNHVEAHNQMLDRLVEISKTVPAQCWNTADIQHFVNRWVLVHILDEDMQLVQHLKSMSNTPSDHPKHNHSFG